jgi:hypothetical protein
VEEEKISISRAAEILNLSTRQMMERIAEWEEFGQMNRETQDKRITRADLLHMIAEGEEDVRRGNLLDSDSVFKSLREEFFETKV